MPTEVRMKPQWYKNLPNSWQDFVDQVLHAALGYAIAWATGYWIASVAVAILREFFQNWWDEKNDRGTWRSTSSSGLSAPAWCSDANETAEPLGAGGSGRPMAEG